MKIHTIKDLRNLIAGKYELVNKSLGIELVVAGFLNYKKLSAKNYAYWWYEVQDAKDARRNVYTYDWGDLVKTKKFELMHKLIQYYEKFEPASRIMNDILQLESTDANAFETVFVFLYENRIHNINKKQEPQQSEFVF